MNQLNESTAGRRRPVLCVFAVDADGNCLLDIRSRRSLRRARVLVRDIARRGYSDRTWSIGAVHLPPTSSMAAEYDAHAAAATGRPMLFSYLDETGETP